LWSRNHNDYAARADDAARQTIVDLRNPAVDDFLQREPISSTRLLARRLLPENRRTRAPVSSLPSATMIQIMAMLCVGLMVEALLVVDVVVRNKRAK
jgi:hypothetical protein